MIKMHCLPVQSLALFGKNTVFWPNSSHIFFVCPLALQHLLNFPTDRRPDPSATSALFRNQIGGWNGSHDNEEKILTDNDFPSLDMCLGSNLSRIEVLLGDLLPSYEMVEVTCGAYFSRIFRIPFWLWNVILLFLMWRENNLRHTYRPCVTKPQHGSFSFRILLWA